MRDEAVRVVAVEHSSKYMSYKIPYALNIVSSLTGHVQLNYHGSP